MNTKKALKEEITREFENVDSIYKKWDDKKILLQSILRNKFYTYVLEQGEISTWEIPVGTKAYFIQENGVKIEEVNNKYTTKVFPAEFLIEVKADSLKKALMLFVKKENTLYTKITQHIKNITTGIFISRIEPYYMKKEKLYIEQISLVIFSKEEK